MYQLFTFFSFNIFSFESKDHHPPVAGFLELKPAPKSRHRDLLSTMNAQPYLIFVPLALVT